MSPMLDPKNPSPETQSIASELIRARSERGFSQTHLSEVSGVSRSAIKSYESGRNMPGSRELLALCTALKVTPNQLLFGRDAIAFEDADAALLDAAMKTDPEARAFARIRLALLAELLTEDEAAALFLLARSIATSRHGVEKVKQALVAADFMASMTRTMITSSIELSKAPKASLDTASVISDVEAMMKRQGHSASDRPSKKIFKAS